MHRIGLSDSQTEGQDPRVDTCRGEVGGDLLLLGDKEAVSLVM